MTEKKEENKEKKTLGLGKGTLSLGGSGTAKARTNIAQGTRGGVVEVRRSRRMKPGEEDKTGGDSELHQLTSEEREARAKALREALDAPKKELPARGAPGAGKTETKDEDDKRREELEQLQRIEEEERVKAEQALLGRGDAAGKPGKGKEVESESVRDRLKRNAAKPTRTVDKRRGGKLTVTQVLNEDYDRDRGMSLAAQRRAREKARLAAQGSKEPAQKVFHEVIVPETITVQELANRMAERSGDVIKALMKMDVMATINEVIDADTAELVISEFGHKIKRVTEADVEEGIDGIEDKEEDLLPRPPVVTIMGHVDHGKTSLLDALRQTDVVGGEAGGITQHIGAYQISTKSGDKITFLDTPGHAAFTEMRARGANVTDIVVLVVAANDSVMPQTIEAINHAKAAEVPIIVAINKIDLPEAQPSKIKQDLLQHDIQVEDMGGDVLAVEVSAVQKTNLDKLEEAILLQSELLELKANPNRAAQGMVIEAKMETGRGSVATILVQNGTLRQGDIFVVGGESGRVRALLNDRGEQIEEAIPGQPVEVLGLNGTPDAGDILNVVGSEKRAQEIIGYRQRQKKDKHAATVSAGRSVEDMIAASKEGEKKSLAVVIKGDVHGSVEAIISSLHKMTEESDEIEVQVLHSGVGGITESDVTLARASGAMLIGFNVRANAQARDQAQRENVTINYYNIIYNVIDDAKALLSGMLSPTQREEYLGQAEIREVFSISKVGKIAGCMVTLGQVKRGAKVRLLRDDVVIHEGMLKTLKRFKDEVKEVKEGMECGMAFESYDDIKEGDVIECFEVIEEARTLE